MSFSNFNLGQRLESLETSDAFDAYARVDVVMGEDEEGEVLTVSYPPSVADDAGRILTVDMPMCTDTAVARRAAQRIYDSLTTMNPTAFQYQPILATKAMADPSMEFGDSVDVNGVHAGFYTRAVTFNQLMETDLTAPSDEEIDHEYPYQDGQQRQITRTHKELKAGLYVTSQAITAEVARVDREVFDASNPTSIKSILNIQADAIEARVMATGGSNSSFGWKLDSESHSWYAGSTEVMRISRTGLVIKGNADITGKITATSGTIGGFTIGSDSIYNNLSSFGGSQSTGVFLGTRGIQLGQNFKVDSSGNGTMNNLTLTGTLTINGTRITSEALRSGAQSAYNNSSTWNGTSSRVSNNSGNWDSGYTYGKKFNNATTYGSGDYPAYFRCSSLQVETIYFGVGQLYIDSQGFVKSYAY